MATDVRPTTQRNRVRTRRKSQPKLDMGLQYGAAKFENKSIPLDDCRKSLCEVKKNCIQFQEEEVNEQDSEAIRSR